MKTLGRYVFVGAIFIAIDFVALALADHLDDPGIRTVADVLAMLFFALDIPFMICSAALLAGVAAPLDLMVLKPHSLGIVWSMPAVCAIRAIQDVVVYTILATCVHFSFRLLRRRHRGQ